MEINIKTLSSEEEKMIMAIKDRLKIKTNNKAVRSSINTLYKLLFHEEEIKETFLLFEKKSNEIVGIINEIQDNHEELRRCVKSIAGHKSVLPDSQK